MDIDREDFARLYQLNSNLAQIFAVGLLSGKILFKYPIQSSYLENVSIIVLSRVLSGKILFKCPRQGSYLENVSIINSCSGWY